MTTKTRRRPYRHRMPRLTDRRFVQVSRDWERAVEHPDVWRRGLAATKARELGYMGDVRAVFVAWGLNPETGK